MTSANRTTDGVAPSQLAPFGSRAEGGPFVVGVGASAGGVEALEQFFERVPNDTGMTFVVVQHLSPDFKSVMDDILSRRTTMPVRIAEDGMRLEPNTIYLNPPRKLLGIRGDALVLSESDASTTVAYPIDHFLSSLAAAKGPRAVAVILSGTGTDGTRGVVDVHAAGGLVLAQEPASASFDGMPRSAIETGTVELMLPPASMGDALLAHAAGRDPRTAEPTTAPPRGMDAVVAMLRKGYGVDFSEYKLPTIARRTERRLRTTGCADLDAYAERLAADPQELDALYRDLLIGVTQFFRDSDAFDSLERHFLPDAIKRLSPEEELRFWVPGCATGEEAYSLAILARECLDDLAIERPVKIFATDVHPEALRFAAAGVYDVTSMAAVSPERRERYFTAKDGGYQVSPAIRSMIVFAPHDLLHDVPFNKLHLVSCRNLLIYLQLQAQRRALGVIGFGLEPGGLLFLGSSESIVGELADDFEVVEPHWKIYRKRNARSSATVFVPPRRGAALRARTVLAATPAPGAVGDSALVGTLDAVLDATLPPGILVGARRNLVQTFAGGNRFLHVPDGRPAHHVVEMLRDELQVAVTGGLESVFSGHAPLRYRGLRTVVGGEPVLVDVTVRKVTNARTGEPFALVTFDEQRPAPDGAAPPASPTDDLARAQVKALEIQLREAQENLQTTIEELEASNEELQATNEELVASNEELQTTNEELHSVNEELFTVNTEFQKKIGQLTELTDDMDLLISSTEVHTLFLDRELRIRRFTPRVAEIFHLVFGDVGRSIGAFNCSLQLAGLVDELRRVVATGEPFERQVQDESGPWYLLRLLPYRRGATVDGAVLALVDITGMKRLEVEARSTHEQLLGILTNSPHPVFIRDREGRYVVVDDSFRRLAGRDPAGMRPEQVFSADVAAMFMRHDERVLREGVTVEAEEQIPTPDGARTFLTVRFPMRDRDGTIGGVGGISTDVTSLKRAEAEAREAATRRDRFLATLSHELRNPLAAILSASRVLSRAEMPRQEVERWHTLILDRAVHMSRLVDDLLDVARLTQDKLVLKCAPVDVASTATGVVDEVAAMFRDRSITLVTEFEPGLLLFGDATRLHQLQVNLLTNAARHTPPGGRVAFTIRRTGNEADIRVADDGEGIDKEVMPNIFDLFVQADAPGSRGQDGGLGVGLALVRRIAELHGGSVAVSSAGRGFGAEFRVLVPLATRHTIDASRTERPTDRPRTVLLVDDDAASRSGMGKLLELDGIAVRTAADGDLALTALAERPLPDLVLLDIGLPRMDGYEVCRRVRALEGTGALLIFALTGFGQDADRDAARGAGFDAHLTKPVDVEDVYAAYAQAAARSARGAVLSSAS